MSNKVYNECSSQYGLVGRQAGWLAGRQVGWRLVGWWAGRQAGRLADWEADWLAGNPGYAGRCTRGCWRPWLCWEMHWRLLEVLAMLEDALEVAGGPGYAV